MVSIPVRLYTATESHDVHFHLLHKRDGVRLQRQEAGDSDTDDFIAPSHKRLS